MTVTQEGSTTKRITHGTTSTTSSTSRTVNSTPPITTLVPTVLSKVADEVPFEIILPTYLPHGTELVSASVAKPPEVIGEEGRRRNTRIELYFQNTDGSARFILYESIAVTGIGESGAVPISIGQVTGEMLEDEERQLLTLAWPGDGIGYVLIAFMNATLTKDDVIKVAESTMINTLIED